MEEGWIDPAVRSEFPELGLRWVEVAARATRSPPELRDQLAELANRIRGPHVVMLRRQPVPWAHRVFFRHIGLDPDVDRTPVEALALQRLKDGGFRSANSLDDALALATMETGVGVWALDAAAVTGALGVRVAARGEPLGRSPEAPAVPEGRLVISDEAAALAVLFGAVAAGHGVTRSTVRMRLFAIEVPGVPALVVEEALWRCQELLS